GAEFTPGLNQDGIDEVFVKGTDPGIDSYSGFFDNGHRKATGLGDWLKEKGIQKVYVMGLATDYCVKFTALDAHELGFETYLIEDASRGVNLNDGDVTAAVADMKAAGVNIVQSDSILQAASA
ncbi:MAG: isochorismatase family protein, partial [Bacteroidota bacterium]